MITSDRSPARDRDAFDCPRCGVYSHQEWFVLKRELEDDRGNEYTEDAYDAPAPDFVSLWAIYGAPSLPVQEVNSEVEPPAEEHDRRREQWAQARCIRCKDFSTWRGERLLYPGGLSVAPPPHEDMPAAARAIYLEAGEVVAFSRRAGAALARATLERLLKILDPEPAKDLAVRIDRFVPKVSSSLAQMLTVIRHTGNKSLHAEDELDEVMVLVLDPDQDEIVGLMFAAINEVVDEMITRPARAQAVFALVPESVRNRGQAKK